MDEDMSAEFDLHALDKKEIRQQVFEQLLSQITTGKWKPGEKIPSENELTSIMGQPHLCQGSHTEAGSHGFSGDIQGKGHFCQGVHHQ